MTICGLHNKNQELNNLNYNVVHTKCDHIELRVKKIIIKTIVHIAQCEPGNFDSKSCDFSLHRKTRAK